MGCTVPKPPPPPPRPLTASERERLKKEWVDQYKGLQRAPIAGTLDEETARYRERGKRIFWWMLVGSLLIIAPASAWMWHHLALWWLENFGR